ncbi:MAG: hypothetical protein ACRCX2_04725 [Paraclostridium sp.]
MFAILLIICKLTFALILEERKTNIALSPDTEIKKIATPTSAFVRPAGIEQKPMADSGPIVSANSPNPSKEWVYEFTIINLNSAFSQQSTVSLFYTTDPLGNGDIKGGHGRFHGLMSDIEFLMRIVEAVLTSNIGDNDITEIEDINVMRSLIYPEWFWVRKAVRNRVLKTSKNVKMKIFDRGKLAIDKLRFMASSYLWNDSSGMHFGIAAFYVKVALDKHFTRRQVQLSNRTEDVTFDPFQYEYEYETEEGRWPATNDHSVLILFRNLESDSGSMSGGLLTKMVIAMLRWLLIAAVKATWFKKESVKSINNE